ncbi:MAG: hypothetical protein JSV56_01665 [Methanomassiliicoccales archaeon]|nr:MAG: hypothetical protein JSV56_01665 [Methanomassiliicoccales archaeon]
MESKTTGSRFFVSRAVEEPLEATVELGEHIKHVSKKVDLPIKLGILAFVIFLILLIPSIYSIISYIWSGLLGGTELTSESLINALTAVLIIIFLIAVITTSLLYLIQINKFNSLNLQRCCAVTDITSARISDDAKSSKEKKPGKHLKNPIFALLDLEEESMHMIPQIVKMLRFCVFFIGITLVILILTYVLKFGLDYDLLFSMDPIRMGLFIVVIVKLIVVLKLLMDTENDFKHIHMRHNIIDSVRFAKDISVPSGESQLDRLIVYLRENDPYIRSSVLAEKKGFIREAKLKGQSGKNHEFDAYLSGMNILKDKSVALGMPMGKFGVFIRIFKEDITLSKLNTLRDSVIDVCNSQNMFPLRIIALQWSIKVLSDEVYEYVLDKPIMMKNTLTHLEVIAEDNEVYSFIPMISYGERLG